MTHSRNILVVEDDLPIRSLIVDLLRDEGYEVRGAADGLAALDEMSWPPHLILLDWMMPVMDGPTFLARQEDLSAPMDAVPVIVVTARRDALADIRAAGVTATVSKPFADQDLLRTVRAVLDPGNRSDSEF